VPPIRPRTQPEGDPAAQADATPQFVILIVEDDPDVGEAIAHAVRTDSRRIYHAQSMHGARECLQGERVDLVLLDAMLPDGDGVSLAAQVASIQPTTRCIVVTGHATLDRAVEAMRAGAVDLVSKPFDIDDLNQRVGQALQRQRRDTQRDRRIDRLRKLCKQLNQARHDISQQVDILCNDLVTAYQELAHQVQNIELTGELRSELADELDLEQTLRRTLEFVLHKVGPTNAVIFLPNSTGGFSVGGYVNYTHEKEHSQVMLQHLADVVAPALAEEAELVHLTEPDALDDWLGEACGWLTGSHVLAGPCLDEDGQPLAGLCLFRDDTEPFDEEAVALMSAICPMLAAHLIKVIRIHHRHKDLFDDEPANGEDDDLFGI